MEIKIEDEDRNFDQITLKKTVFEEEELKDPQNIVDMPNDFTAELVEPVDVSMEDTKVVLEITNPLGIRKRLEFSIKIAGFTPDITALELKQKHFLPRELQSEEALFDIPVGMSVMIEPVDASTVGEKMIQVTFFKNGKSLIKQYAIHILPELNARLKNKNFLKSELADINNVIEVDEGFHVVYVKHPDLNTLGEQEIVVLITDDYNHSLQMKFKIHVYEKEEHGHAPSPDYGSDDEISNHSSGSIPKVERITKNQKAKDAKKDPLSKSQLNAEKTEKEKQKNKNNERKITDEFLTDIREHWAKEAIYRAYQDGYIKGYPDGSFKPNNSMLRSEFASLSNRVFALPPVEFKLNFNDVDLKSWYYQDVSTQVAHGLIKGISDERFHPDGSITRAEVLVIFMRYIEKFHKELLGKTKIKKANASDIKEISSWAADSFDKAYSIGLVKGDQNNRLFPNKPITRAEVVQLIYNFLILKNKQ